jgi:hypothetical protein
MKSDIAQLEYVHPKLRKLITWLEESTGFEFTETSRYRMEGDGVHTQLPVRGEDLRCRSKEIGLAVEAYINKSWKYDQKRPHLKCCFLHGEGSNLHLHLQVHDNTEYIG